MLASRPAKRQAEAWFGPRSGRGFYRPFYLTQSVFTLAVLLLYLSRLPDRSLYRLRGFPAALRLGQLGGLVLGSWHEERRRSAAYGAADRRYQQSGVSFYLPRLN